MSDNMTHEPSDPIDYVNIDRRYGDLDLHLDIEDYQRDNPDGEFRYALDGWHSIEEKRGDKWVTVALEVDAIEEDDEDDL
jgi:hypothetical protein